MGAYFEMFKRDRSRLCDIVIQRPGAGIVFHNVIAGKGTHFLFTTLFDWRGSVNELRNTVAPKGYSLFSGFVVVKTLLQKVEISGYILLIAE